MKRCDEIMLETETIQKNLRRHVHHLSETIGERHIWKNGSLAKATEYIDAVFRESNLSADHQKFSCYGETVSNLIVKIEGKKPDLVVIGAHYDTVPGSPGADDNASSVAVMLEIARLCKEIQNEHSIAFAALVNEESPCYGTENMGSMVYADRLKRSGVPVKFMICLESVGFFTTDEIQKYPFPGMKLFYPRSADFLGVIGNIKSLRYVTALARAIRKNADIEVRSLVAPEHVAGINRSDHFAFWHFGYKAVMITDTANFRNNNYHRETDTIDTLNFDSMAEIVKGLFNAFKKF